jgi:methylphosphotriester-DNA--protein-cysteine methyltransferase
LNGFDFPPEMRGTGEQPYLITKFRQQVGLAPKTAARLVRFEQVWRRLGDGGPAHWDRIAAYGGYADQSHLIRDFREFTGGSPAEFLARSTPAAPSASP